jgi:hypothetical protein
MDRIPTLQPICRIGSKSNSFFFSVHFCWNTANHKKILCSLKSSILRKIHLKQNWIFRTHLFWEKRFETSEKHVCFACLIEWEKIQTLFCFLSKRSHSCTSLIMIVKINDVDIVLFNLFTAEKTQTSTLIWQHNAPKEIKNFFEWWTSKTSHCWENRCFE